MKGYIHSVETFGAVDGPGIRYVLFMQGCFLRCQYCHNPDTWTLKNGKRTTIKNIVNDIKKYLNYIKDGGVTISGGEPLLQSKFVYKLIKKIKRLDLHVAIDTAGTVPLNISKKILNAVDLVLLDIKALDNPLCKKITGFDNENTLQTLKYCEKINKAVWIRHVLVPSLTLKEESLKKLAIFLKNFNCIKKTELIPFHKMGEFKWKDLNINYKLKNTPATTKEQLKVAEDIFNQYNKE